MLYSPRGIKPSSPRPEGEVILCIEQAMRSRKLQPEVYLARARRLREKTKQYLITDEEFSAAKVR